MCVYLSYDSAFYSLVSTQEKWKHVHKKTCTQMFINSITYQSKVKTNYVHQLMSG